MNRRLLSDSNPIALSAQVFVDSCGGFGYSESLARCCAWGLCVFTRTRLDDALKGSAGTGHRRLDADSF
jgi:hypothetical protein